MAPPRRRLPGGGCLVAASLPGAAGLELWGDARCWGPPQEGQALELRRSYGWCCLNFARNQLGHPDCWDKELQAPGQFPLSYERCCLAPEPEGCTAGDGCSAELAEGDLGEESEAAVGGARYTLGLRGRLAQRRHLDLRHPLVAGLGVLQGCDTAAWDEVLLAVKVKGGCLPCSTPPPDLARYLSLQEEGCLGGRLLLAMTGFVAVPEGRVGQPPPEARAGRAEALQLLTVVERELAARLDKASSHLDEASAAWPTLTLEEFFFDIFGVTPVQVRYMLHHSSLREDYPPVFQYHSTWRSSHPMLDTAGQEPRSEQPPLAFDLGTSGGMDAFFYLVHGFRVVAVEANPLVALDLHAVLRRYQDRLHIVNAAIVSDEELAERTDPGSLGVAEVSFHIHRWRPDFSALDAERVPRALRAGTLPVRAVSCAGLVAKYGPPVSVKIDAEGADRACLTSLRDAGAVPPYISTELPNVIEDGSLPGVALVRLLVSMGYVGFKLCRQSFYNSRVVLAVDQETNRTDKLVSRQGLGLGASGPLGEAAVDWLMGPRWRPSQEVLEELGPGGPVWVASTMHEWFDLHAKWR